MPILKETFFACLEEGIEAGNRVRDIVDAVKMLLEKEERSIDDWEGLGRNVLKGGYVDMTESRVRMEGFSKNWVRMEREKKRKRIAKIVEEDRQEVIAQESGKAVGKKEKERPYEYYMIIADLCTHSVFKDCSEERREELAEIISQSNLNEIDKKAFIERAANRELRLRGERNEGNS